jgi:hypothetical protein
MENKVTIKEQLNAIVYAELKGLIKVVDEWFNSQSEPKYELVLGTSSNDAPIINLYTEDNDPVQYYVKGIAVAHEGYYLELIWKQGPFNDEHICAHYLEGDACDAWEFIPGEIDRLTDEVLKAIHPEEECYHFSDEQMDAIKKFESALKRLNELNVYVLPETEDKQFYFANGAKGCCFDSDNNLLDSGEYEKVASMDVKRLPHTDEQYDTDFDMGGLDLVKSI